MRQPAFWFAGQGADPAGSAQADVGGAGTEQATAALTPTRTDVRPRAAACPPVLFRFRPLPVEIVKYFYEEPFSLEALTPDLDSDARQRGRPAGSLEALLSRPAYHRGYLAGTDLAADRVGLTALPRPEAFTAPLLDAFGAYRWMRCDADGRPREVAQTSVGDVLRDPVGTSVLACADAELPGDLLTDVRGGVERQTLPALRRLLARARAAFFPEPAHHGFDWNFFSAHPMRSDLVAAFRRHPLPDVRRFALPYQKARSEHKFYFERWQLGGAELPAYIEEV